MNIDKISPKRIRTELDKAVSGQSEAKDTLAIVAYNHILRYYNDVETKYDIGPPRLTCLLTGPTGCGKTLLIDTLADIVNLPYMKIDATTLTMPGFVGTSLGDYIQLMHDKYQRTDLGSRLDRAIVFIDEIDKLGMPASSTHHGNHNKVIQGSLLTLLDGSEVYSESNSRRAGPYDTKNMLFILAGAFEEVYIKRAKDGVSIGFNASVEDSVDNNAQHYKLPLSHKELEDSGLIRELIGRISVTSSIYKLSKDELRWALESVYDSMLSQYTTTFALSDTYLPVTEEDIDAIVDKLYNSRYGMRHARSILFDHFKDQLLALEGINVTTVTEEEIIEAPTLRNAITTQEWCPYTDTTIATNWDVTIDTDKDVDKDPPK